MWSRRFLWIGLGSSLLVAALAAAIIWLVMRLALSLTFPLDLASYAVCCVIGVAVYPPLWALLVYMRQSYSTATTYCLIGATYFASSAIVVGIFMLIGQHVAADMERSRAANRYASAGPAYLAAMPHPQVLYGRLALGGAILFILPFAAIAGPLAFLHRRVLLSRPV
jgi:hypothetical protein